MQTHLGSFYEKHNYFLHFYILLTSWPLNLSDFGLDDINTIVDQYESVLKSQGVDTEKLHPEWIRLRNGYYQRY